MTDEASRDPEDKGPRETAELLRAATTLGDAGTYTETDQYRDFKAVFTGSEQGRRVLHAILGWGQVFRSSAALGGHETNRTVFHEGERNLALRILRTTTVEPRQRPERGRTKPQR